MMATTAIEAIGTYLQAQGQGTLGTNLFIGVMPGAPDALVTLYEGNSTAPIVTMGAAAFAVDRLNVRAIVRGVREDYPTPRDKALAIRSLLAGITHQTLSGITVMRVETDGYVIPLGPDDLDRPRFSVNFTVHVVP